MSRIEQLLTSLNEIELSILTTLNLKGKQKIVLDVLIKSCRDGKRLDPDSLGLSTTHFHEISSILLQKCLSVLAPKGVHDICRFLVEKQLPKLLKRQIKLLEKSVKQFSTNEEKEHFYLIAFEYSQRVPPIEMDWGEIRYYGEMYRNYKKEHFTNDYAFTELRILRSKIRLMVSGKSKPSQEKAIILKNLIISYRKQLAAEYFPDALYQCLMVEIQYYIYIKHEPQLVYELLKKALSLIDKIHPLLRDIEKESLLQKIAYTKYILGHFTEAYTLYSDIYIPRMNVPHRLSLGVIHLAELAVINDELTIAENLLLQYIEPDGKQSQKYSINSRGAFTLALLYMLQERFRESMIYINLAYSLNKGKSHSLRDELRIRFVETAYFILQGDWEYATQLIDRSRRFMQRHHIALKGNVTASTFSLMDAVILKKTTDTEIPTKVYNQYEYCSKNHHRFCSLLLKKILDVV